jgi:hypothetical protein
MILTPYIHRWSTTSRISNARLSPLHIHINVDLVACEINIDFHFGCTESPVAGSYFFFKGTAWWQEVFQRYISCFGLRCQDDKGVQ